MSKIGEIIMGKPKEPKLPPPPANTPTRVDAATSTGGNTLFQSLVGTGSTSGLKRRAAGNKRSLIGGSS